MLFLQLMITFWRHRPLINFYDNIKCSTEKRRTKRNTQVCRAALQVIFFYNTRLKANVLLGATIKLYKMTPSKQSQDTKKGVSLMAQGKVSGQPLSQNNSNF